MKDVICPVCGSSAVSASISQVENIWPTVRAVNFCTHCQLYFLAQMPTEEEIVSYYKNDYYQFPFYLDLIKRAFRRSRSINQFHYIKSSIHLVGGKVLEVGACDGMLLKQFAAKNEVVGLELSDKYRALAKQRYNVELLDGKFEKFEGQYDLLIMSHALEHFPDISATMEKVKALLKSGGYLFVEVPNSPRPEERTTAEIKHYLHGAHTFNFTVPSLDWLMRSAGFDVVCMDRLTYDIPGFYSVRRRQRLGQILIGGCSFSIGYAPDVLMYLAKILLTPRLGFRKLASLDEPYEGPGDMLRVVARRK